MTDSQITKWNKMVKALKTISEGFMEPEELRDNAEKEYGLTYEDALEMSYENIQVIAAQGVKGIKEIKLPIIQG